MVQALPDILAAAENAIADLRAAPAARMQRGRGVAPARPMLLHLLVFAYMASTGRAPGGSDYNTREDGAEGPFVRFARAVCAGWPGIAGTPEARSLLDLAAIELQRQGRAASAAWPAGAIAVGARVRAGIAVKGTP